MVAITIRLTGQLFSWELSKFVLVYIVLFVRVGALVVREKKVDVYICEEPKGVLDWC